MEMGLRAAGPDGSAYFNLQPPQMLAELWSVGLNPMVNRSWLVFNLFQPPGFPPILALTARLFESDDGRPAFLPY